MNDASDLFDEYAAAYEETLARSLAASGENREFFAQRRIAWLDRCIKEMGQSPRRLLDFGCGDGATTPKLLAIGQIAVGIDVSHKSIDIARKRHASDRIEYQTVAEFESSGQIDLAYCNGVFHHIAVERRPEALGIINRALRAGGLFSLWENNPWSLATRYIMSRCPFDRDAILVSPIEARSLLSEGGFEILRTDFRFIFPRALRALRTIEDLFYRLPLGAQYQILARKIRPA